MILWELLVLLDNYLIIIMSVSWISIGVKLLVIFYRFII